MTHASAPLCIVPLDGFQPLPQHLHPLLLSALCLPGSTRHDMVCQEAQPAQEHVEPHIEEAQLAEHEGIVPVVLLQHPDEGGGELRPVHPGVVVVDDVVAVIVGDAVVCAVNAVVRHPERTGRLGVHKNVLAPVAQHGQEGGEHVGDDEAPEGGHMVEPPQQRDGSQVAELGAEGGGGPVQALLPERVCGQCKPAT
eukprot:CAMPEP_0202905766 /NCGR_PEP_ID=MMETSP1392-20130828/35956_1 /ASSEMBLY_ACC=CAM_ASM_000868 /TAXON_ID=225041 /ORGANISM="Chlamydomonas chlamydogama, Strain SAG 11-48b" /LENGTH=195 /DNA_ID=CAMNT_0049594023 /DNA_START=554 /DNA_END=1141 /DNA_ORIENTATION=+